MPARGGLGCHLGDSLAGFLASLFNQSAGFGLVGVVFRLNHFAECFGGCFSLLEFKSGGDVGGFGVLHCVLCWWLKKASKARDCGGLPLLLSFFAGVSQDNARGFESLVFLWRVNPRVQG